MAFLDVLITCYNAGKYVDKAIQCLIRQTFSDFEVYIIDDGSTDNSLEVIKREIEGDSRFHICQNDKNHGIRYSKNVGLKLCKSQYIAYMDADDEMPYDRFEKEVDYVKKHPTCDIVSGGYQIISESGEMGAKVLFGELDTLDIYSVLFFRNILAEGSCIIRKAFIDEHDLWYDESFQSIGDYNFWVDCMKAGANIHIMNEVMQYYRKVSTGISAVNSAADKLKRRNYLFNQIHQKLLENYKIELSDRERQVYFEYTNEVWKSKRKRIQDYFGFMRMISKLEKQNPFGVDRFVEECRKLKQKYY